MTLGHALLCFVPSSKGLPCGTFCKFPVATMLFGLGYFGFPEEFIRDIPLLMRSWEVAFWSPSFTHSRCCFSLVLHRDKGDLRLYPSSHSKVVFDFHQAKDIVLPSCVLDFRTLKLYCTYDRNGLWIPFCYGFHLETGCFFVITDGSQNGHVASSAIIS